MNRRLLIPLAVGVVLVILWFVALWRPQSSALSNARKRTSDATQQGATLRDELARLQQAQRDLPLKQSQLETLRVAVPDDPSLAQFILDANDAASKSGIDFLSISPTPPGSSGGGATAPAAGAGASAGPTPVPIRISMSATGGYFQVLDFVNRLDALPRIVVVDSLELTAQAGGSQLQASLQERIFTTSSAPVGGGSAGGGTTTGSSTTTTSAPGATTSTTRAGGG